VGESSATGVSSGKVALYRKYRPTSFQDVISQPQVTDVLDATIKAGQFGHAYLFTGQRGTGKTSTARILAHLINDTPYDADDPNTDLDIIEIDAASRGSIDDARELRDKSVIAPVSASHKIYIIDEVHMLSTAAFNALLKIIEEPPAHIVFILATTEIQKVPATILSRVQRFHFRPVSTEAVATHLRQIADKEKIKVDDEALNLIAERGQGSFRDSISLLDQLSNSDAKITRATVEEILGLAPETAIATIIDAITAHDVPTLVTTLNDLFKEGVPPALIVDQLISELSKLALEKPKQYDLIEKLLEISKSSAPDIKLTAVLATAATKNNPVISAAAVATPSKSDISEEKLVTIIEKKIAKEDSSFVNEPKAEYSLSSSDSQSLSFSDSFRRSKPDSRNKSVNDGLGKPVNDEPDRLRQSITVTTRTSEETRNDGFDERTVATGSARKSNTDNLPAEIVWNDILAEVVKLDNPTVSATLKFADHEYDNGKIVLYFAKPFHRKKADTAKFRGILGSAFQNIYKSAPDIMVSSSAVRENSDAAKILDIMGGGEVVRNGKA
jgi:DNA polymerase-3 subunit gamma/tau